MSIVIDRRRELAEKHLSGLKTRREMIAKKLQAVQDAVTKIAGQPLSHADFTTTLVQSPRSREMKLAAVKFWVAQRGGSFMQMTDEALLNGMIYPPDLQNLLSAVKGAVGLSKDPARYWQGGRFKPVPVTEAEKDLIFKRAEVRVSKEEDVALVKHLQVRCYMANRHNANTYSGKITSAEVFGPGNSLYAKYIEYDTSEDEPRFQIKAGSLISKGEYREIFDEGGVTL